MIYDIKNKYSPYFVSGVVWVLFLFCALGLAYSHLDANPSQWIMTQMVWLFPIVWLLRFPDSLCYGEKLLLAGSTLMFLSAFLSFSLYEEVLNERSFRTYWLYLLPLGLVPLLSAVRIKKEWFYSLLVFSSLLSLVVVFKDIMFGGTRGEHHGLPIPYGAISLTTSLMCIIFSQDRSLSLWFRGLLIVSSILALVAVVWSQTRGAWLYLVLWSLIAALIWLKNESSLKKKFSISVLVSSLVLLIAITPVGGLVYERSAKAYNEVESYLDGSVYSSSGQRLVLWEISVNAFLDNPVFGVARQGFIDKRNEMSEENQVLVYRSLKHSHNDVLWVAATRGAIGVFILIALYAGLARYYWQHISESKTRVLGYAGLTVVAGAIVYGFTDIYMSLKITVGYFMIINAFLISILKYEGSSDNPATT